ncbi:MAG: DUF3500 domain-containing protein [Bacteroidota bacterium]
MDTDSEQKMKFSKAIKFLHSLNNTQREKTQFDFEDASKTKWHYLPGATRKRAGIQLFELNETQKELLFLLLQDFLSESGYSKTKQIIALEEVLVQLGGSSVVRDPEKYFAAFYGNPERDSLWAWSFEGHHISLNFTVLNDRISMAPRFFGANPAIIPDGKRKGERTLGKEEDYGLELINSMSASQKQKAIFRKNAFFDITTTNAPEVNPPEPAGIEMNDLDPAQQNILVNLINEYLSAMPPELASKRMENLKQEEFDKIRFGWAGATKLGEPHYYRIQGKTFLVEFDNTQNNANHIHTVWRDFDGDFGRDLIREHYRMSEHHSMH